MSLSLKSMKVKVFDTLAAQGTSVNSSEAKSSIEGKIQQAFASHVEQLAKMPMDSDYPSNTKPYHLQVGNYVKGSYEQVSAAAAKIAVDLASQGATNVAYKVDVPHDGSAVCSFSFSFDMDAVR